jgi:hypothetical protein
MNYTTIVYILAISLQVAGALLLMVHAVSAKRSKVIRRFSGRGLIYKDGNTGELSYDKEAFKDSFKDVYLNKSAFAFIALGYALGVFGENKSDNRLIVLLCIIASTGILIIAAQLIVSLVVKNKKNAKFELTDEELVKAGKSADIGSISNEGLQEILNEVFTNDVK